MTDASLTVDHVCFVMNSRSFTFELFHFDFVQAENVYSEVLFSIVHAISFIDFPSGADDVLVYLRSSFQVSEARHQELLDGINQRSVHVVSGVSSIFANGLFEQPPEVTLQLNVVEARNLKGKDVNGTCKQVNS